MHSILKDEQKKHNQREKKAANTMEEKTKWNEEKNYTETRKKNRICMKSNRHLYQI